VWENLASSSSSLGFLRIPRLASIGIYTARYASIWITQPRRHSHWERYQFTVATISEVKGQCSTVGLEWGIGEPLQAVVSKFSKTKRARRLSLDFGSGRQLQVEANDMLMICTLRYSTNFKSTDWMWLWGRYDSDLFKRPFVQSVPHNHKKPLCFTVGRGIRTNRQATV
jgi:hypothetical protein